MNSPPRGAWKAITVPTFKMRIAQSFIVVLAIVMALVGIALYILSEDSEARRRTENAGKASVYAAVIDEGLQMEEAAFRLLESGQVQDADRDFTAGRLAANKALVRLRAIEVKGGRRLADDLGERQSELLKLYQDARALMVGGVGAQIAGIRDEILKVFENAQGEVASVRELAGREMAGAIDISRSVTRQGLIGLGICLAATFVLGFVMMTVSYRGISGVVRRVTAEVREISTGSGDLAGRVTVPTPDVMGDLAGSINDMVVSLRSSMLETRSIATELAGSAESLAGSIEGMSASVQEASSAAEQISTGSEAQARKIEGTSLAIARVSGSIDEIAEKARVSSEQSAYAAALAEKGGAAAGEAVAVMQDIHMAAQGSERLIGELGERLTQVGVIVDVITDIAERTNLLALNAAIEAARAGEHGRGFAVVAEEVRDLAENSRRSAGQISNLIREIHLKAGEVTGSIEEGTEKARHSRRAAENTGEALGGITASSQAAAEAAEEISGAISTIAENTDRVFATVNDITAIAEQTAASTEEVAATLNEQTTSTEEISSASLSLARLASRLHELTKGFKL